MKVSVVIRTLNEEKYLEELFQSINNQDYQSEVECILVDSGSTDSTLDIAKKYNAKIVHISKEEFTFGRSLNFGCQASSGEIQVFISGHCIPKNNDWLQQLAQPIIDDKAHYTYSRQIGGPTSKFSECQLFKKYYPQYDKVPQKDFFCNNASSAILKSLWERYKFDETLTGLEDMGLSKVIFNAGYKVGYCSKSIVFHHHDELWSTVKRRYERESIALRYIMPEIHLNFIDVVRYFFSGILYDFSAALKKKVVLKELKSIILFRLMQYWGSYQGNREHRKISKKQKYLYFYPKDKYSKD